MNPMTKRKVASWVLMAVYVPMLLLSSLHIHHTPQVEEATAHECVDAHCHGHLTGLSTTMHQCILCQFLTMTFVATVLAAVVFLQPEKPAFYLRRCRTLSLKPCGSIQLRAPPAGV